MLFRYSSFSFQCLFEFSHPAVFGRFFGRLGNRLYRKVSRFLKHHHEQVLAHTRHIHRTDGQVDQLVIAVGFDPDALPGNNLFVRAAA
jgi:hypothetical protein